MADDIITRDDNGDLAVNVVTSTEGNVPYNYDDCFTLDTNGRRALRVVGAGGGGDSHNKGYFATQSALEEAYPTGEAGDYAIVGSTDTVWIWDEDSSEWIDSDQKGQVTSVNGQTGAVTVSEVPSQTGYSGRVLGTDGFVAGWVVPEKVQRSTMPQASEEEVDNIYQYVGTTDANYTNGYFYKCVSDGQDPATYSWTRVDIQPAPVIPDPLPSQTGNAGKFLTTDGTDASWSNKPLVNRATGYNALAIGVDSTASGMYAVHIGESSGGSGNRSIAIGKSAIASADGSIQINTNTIASYNSDANTFKVANANGNYEIMSADGTIPADRLKNAINKYSTMPTASADNLGWIVQFTGTTDSTYTHGHLYECVSDGADPATYSWSEVQLGGGNYLPLTGGIMTGDVEFKYDTTKNGVGLGVGSEIGFNALYLGYFNNGTFTKTIRLGSTGSSHIYPMGPLINLGASSHKWYVVYTEKLNNGADIAVPTTGGTMAVIGVNTTATLAVADWSSNTQTVTVSGVKADSVVFVSPAPASASDYVSAGIFCTAQAADSLTFTCTTTPTNAITVNVICM